jgi:hypothetical protein
MQLSPTRVMSRWSSAVSVSELMRAGASKKSVEDRRRGARAYSAGAPEAHDPGRRPAFSVVRVTDEEELKGVWSSRRIGRA